MLKTRQYLLIPLLALWGALSAHAATVSLPDRGAAPGDSVEIPVMLDSLASMNGATLTITYDDGDLVATDVTAGTLTAGWFVVPQLGTPGRVSVSLMAMTPVDASAGGSIVNLVFSVRATAVLGHQTAMALTQAELYAPAGTTIPTTDDGLFTCVDANPPGPATNLAAADTPNDSGGSVTVTWNKSPDDGDGANDVVTYAIQRATTATGPFVTVGSVLPDGSATYTYLDNADNSTSAPVNGTQYWYQVVTHDATNAEPSTTFGPATPSYITAAITLFDHDGTQMTAQGAFVRGVVDIIGTAKVEGGTVGSYMLEWGPGANPGDTDWLPLALPVIGTEKDNQVLHAAWDTAAVQPQQSTGTGEAVVSLRLTVSDPYYISISKPIVTFTIDNTPPVRPTATIAAPPGNEIYLQNGDTITIAADIEPNSTLLSAALVDESGTTLDDLLDNLDYDAPTGHLSGSVTVADFGQAARVRVKLQVADAAGNSSVVGSSSDLFIDNGNPTVSILAPDDSSIQSVSPIRIAGRVSDAVSRVVSLEISTNNGASFAPADGFDGHTFSHSYIPPVSTTYFFIARATDVLGNSQVSDVVRVSYLSGFLSATITAPLNGDILHPGADLDVTGSVRGANANETDLAWTLDWQLEGDAIWTTVALGDTNVLDGALATWSVPPDLADGTYTLRLTATQGANTVTCQRALTVGGLPEAPIPLEPAYGATNVAPLNTRFSWSRSNGATQYKLMLRRKPGQ